MPVGIRVTGLVELNRALRQLDDARAQAEVKKASRDAAQTVTRLARSRGLSLGSTAAHTIKTGALTAGPGGVGSASVRLDGTAPTEYALGAEFGGRGRPTTQQFQPHRGTRGYFLYPTIRDHMDQIVAEYSDALDRIIRRAFP